MVYYSIAVFTLKGKLHCYRSQCKLIAKPNYKTKLNLIARIWAYDTNKL